ATFHHVRAPGERGVPVTARVRNAPAHRADLLHRSMRTRPPDVSPAAALSLAVSHRRISRLRRKRRILRWLLAASARPVGRLTAGCAPAAAAAELRAPPASRWRFGAPRTFARERALLAC